MKNHPYAELGLTNIQAYNMNRLLKEFNKQFDYYGPLRLGQAFYNFYYGYIFHEPFPLLFYCEDNEKVHELIRDTLIVFVKKMED